MNPFAVISLICCLATVHARPTYIHGGGGGGGGPIQLEGIPNESHYGKLTYPKFDIIHLGSAIKDSLPPAVIEINKKVIIKEPQPYPVKVPVPVPHPVEVPKPYPVIETKIIKVPHPVPVEVIKKIPVPFEVPKPYPVPSGEYGHSYGGHGQLGHQVNEENQGGYGAGFEGGLGGLEHAADQSQAYSVQQEPQQWVPVESEEQQVQEHEQ